MKAIITDLDRTLLHTDKSISEYTVDILRRCRERGMLIMTASSRPLRDIIEFNKIIELDAIAATNGALISIPDKIIEFGISKDIGEKILSNILLYPDIFLSAETHNGLYSNRDIPVWQPVIWNDFPKLPENTNLYKILVSSENNDLYRNIQSALTDDVYYTIANKELIQIMSRNATKWNGILHMLSHFNVLPEDAVYFGDDNDDIEAIKNCGIGVAVSNAIPSVLEIADKITSDNDSDGVAKFIEENIL